LHFCWRYELEWSIELLAKEIDMVGILIMAVRGDIGLDGKVHQRDLQRYLDSVFTEQAEDREFEHWKRFWHHGGKDWKELLQCFESSKALQYIHMGTQFGKAHELQSIDGAARKAERQAAGKEGKMRLMKWKQFTTKIECV
jgi:hypothetical protein